MDRARLLISLALPVLYCRHVLSITYTVGQSGESVQVECTEHGGGGGAATCIVPSETFFSMSCLISRAFSSGLAAISASCRPSL
jgi:hypothetical protein